MGMFDTYRPTKDLQCPVCGTPLREWQGKEGPCCLFVWQAGIKHPVESEIQAEDLEGVSLEEWNGIVGTQTLPPEFFIYSYDCPVHYPVDAYCRANEEEGWVNTVIVPYHIKTRDRHSRTFIEWLSNIRNTSLPDLTS
ncbi:MAG: hypothetical protein M3Z04_20075 [Chloroflexota bacterium]|nr:hypothetical protein [Chloroflexota bacterium]